MLKVTYAVHVTCALQQAYAILHMQFACILAQPTVLCIPHAMLYRLCRDRTKRETLVTPSHRDTLLLFAIIIQCVQNALSRVLRETSVRKPCHTRVIVFRPHFRQLTCDTCYSSISHYPCDSNRHRAKYIVLSYNNAICIRWCFRIFRTTHRQTNEFMSILTDQPDRQPTTRRRCFSRMVNVDGL